MYKKSTLFLIYFKNYRDYRYTCNPRKFEIPALRFPRKVPVNPCKHLQCTIHKKVFAADFILAWPTTFFQYIVSRIFQYLSLFCTRNKNFIWLKFLSFQGYENAKQVGRYVRASKKYLSIQSMFTIFRLAQLKPKHPSIKSIKDSSREVGKEQRVQYVAYMSPSSNIRF